MGELVYGWPFSLFKLCIVTSSFGMRNINITSSISLEPLVRELGKFRKKGSFRQDCSIVSRKTFIFDSAATRPVSLRKHRELLAAPICVKPNPIRLVSFLINANVVAENVVAYQYRFLTSRA